jgi:hypothetical protein
MVTPPSATPAVLPTKPDAREEPGARDVTVSV